ncbi:MAG: hypothetical protein WDZ96_05845 [Acidimicrobiia bacterium]
MKSLLKYVTCSDRGTAMVEYALMAALVAVIAVPAVSMVGHNTEDTFDAIGQSLAGGDSSDPGDEAPAPEEDDDDAPVPGGDDDAPVPGDDDDAPVPGDDDDAPVPGDGDDAPAPGSEAVVASTDASFFWWNNDKHGGEGAWKATVQYQNDHNRHQHLTLEITRTDHKGKTTTTKVDGFYVPANGESTFEVWDNDLKVHKNKTTGVVSVEVKVVSVTTSDENWQEATYPQYDNSTTVNAPPDPAPRRPTRP